MQLQFWGVRGSTPTTGVTYSRYGGNTSCYCLRLSNGNPVILDAGSGLRNLGENLLEDKTHKKCSILLTHGHWDHVCGLHFFAPLFKEDWEVTFYVPECIGGLDPQTYLKNLFSLSLFAVTWEDLPSQRKIVSLANGQTVNLSPTTSLTTFAANHGPKNSDGFLTATAYRIQVGERSLFYSGDHELSEDDLNLKSPFSQGLCGVDIALVDTQYTLEDFKQKRGWGHSALELWLPLISPLQIKTLVSTHYDPTYDDQFLSAFTANLLAKNPQYKKNLLLAHEGLSINIGQDDTEANFYHPVQCKACLFSSEFLEIPDLNAVLDALLQKARNLSGADAGTIYLLEDDELVFAYSHNDSLFTRAQAARQQYLNARLALAPHSIAGYTALTGEVLNIADVRKLDPDVPYTFNDSFDNATGYRTVSICAVPIYHRENELLGVLQLINHMEDDKPLPFTYRLAHILNNLAQLGGQAIGRALATREMLLRVLETARMRDPAETGPHVSRVGAMAAELYHHWAEKRGVDIVEILSTKAHLRLAAMLHDLGKVGIPDHILKKQGPLTPEERQIMETHCHLGATIFKNATSPQDYFAANITLHHHQKWNGTGYCGRPNGPILAGENIPFEARITALVDVFDALLAPRCYKKPIPLNQTLEIIQKEAGEHFDPEMVKDFMEILETMLSIQRRYQDAPSTSC